MAPPRKPLPPLVIPEKKKREKAPPRGTRAFERYINAHPSLRPYGQAIAQYAQANGIDALFFASLIFAESGGRADADSGQAAGLTQISYGNLRAMGKSAAWIKQHPEFALKWSAEKLGRAYKKYGNYHDAYTKDYNPRDANREKAWARIDAARPKGYNWGVGPGVSTPPRAPETPAEKAARLERELAARSRAASGRLQREGFQKFWGSLNDIYQSYAGRNANSKEAHALWKNQISSFALIKGLTKRKSFFGSPVWEAKSRDYYGIARDLGMKVDRKLVALAIANKWDGSAFAEKLREQPGYLKSSEFKNQEASLGNIYRSIYGEPDENIKLTLKEMTLGRWKPDQVAKYLRDLPEYRNSAEYRSKTYELQAAMGFLPTQQAQAPPAFVGTDFEPAPNSPRIKGAPKY